MARILFLTQVLPYPLNTGARVRQYYVLKYLSQQHEVTLVSFVRSDDRAEHIAHVLKNPSRQNTKSLNWETGARTIRGS